MAFDLSIPELNHGLQSKATWVQAKTSSLSTMVASYWERLEPLLKDAGLTPAEFARKMAISYQAMKKVMNGGAFGKDNNAKAANLLNVSSDWLATGKGQKERNAQPVGTAFEVLTDDELRMLSDFRAMMDDDRDELAAEIQRRAERIRTHIRKLGIEKGLPNMVAQTADARRRPFSTSVPVSAKLKQRSLLSGD